MTAETEIIDDIEIVELTEHDIAVIIYRIVNETSYCWAVRELKNVLQKHGVMASENMVRKITHFLTKEYLVREKTKINEKTGKKRLCYAGIPNPPKVNDGFLEYLHSKPIA